MTDKFGNQIAVGDYVTYYAARKNRTINKSAGESAEVVSIGKKKIGIKLSYLSPYRIYVNPKNCLKTTINFRGLNTIHLGRC